MSTTEDLLETLLERIPEQALIATDVEGRITHWGMGALRMFGFKAAAVIGRTLSTVVRREDGSVVAPKRVIAEADTSVSQRFLHEDGSVVFAAGRTEEVKNAAGEVTGYLTILRDARDGYADAEFLRSVLAASDDCIKVLDLDAQLTFMSEGGMRVMEVSDFNQIRGCAWPSVWHGELSAVAQAAVDRAKGGGRARFQGAANTIAGTPKWWDVQVSPILGIDGKPEKLLSVSRDITELKSAEERRRLMTEELAHRVKNTLALVQSLATQTFRTAKTLDDARRTFTNRIQAMARANDLLVRGEVDSATLADLASDALALLDVQQRERIDLDGPRIVIGARSGISVSLMLHELTTNALKYGALSNEHGRVRLNWDIEPEEDGDRLALTWAESGGPNVAKPDRKGFGSRLIGESLPQMLGGTMAKDWRSEGLVARLDVPLAAIAV